MAVPTGEVQRSLATTIREVHRCARTQQQLNGLDVASITGEEQWSFALSRPLIHVHACLEQQLGRSRVVVVCSKYQRCPAGAVAHREEAAVLVLEPLVDGLVHPDVIDQRPAL